MPASLSMPLDISSLILGCQTISIQAWKSFDRCIHNFNIKVLSYKVWGSSRGKWLYDEQNHCITNYYFLGSMSYLFSKLTLAKQKQTKENNK